MRRSDPVADGPGLAALAAAAVTGAVVWAGAGLAAWSSGDAWPRAQLPQTVAAVLVLAHHLSAPAGAWPPGTFVPRAPAPPVFYTWWAVLIAVVSSVTLVVRRRTRPSRRLGARWARASDMRSLARRRPLRPAGRHRLVVGRLGRRLVATEARHSVLVIGPTQSGKTSGLAIPALLEWEGPVVATSVKDDLAGATSAWRSGRGPCWVFDPTGSLCPDGTAGAVGAAGTARWSPVEACRDWSAAQRMAGWLVEATPGRAGMADAAFWYATAAKQLAPLLLAAERGGLGMHEVVRWTDSSDFDEPGRLLDAAGEYEAALALTASAGRDDRIRSSVGTTLETVLAPFGDPVVATRTAVSDVDLDRLFGANGTLYLCGPSQEQVRVQGLFAALVSAVVAEAHRRVAESGRPLEPPLLLVLDEVANIAPLRDLDTLASTGAGLGIQLVTVCQDLSQLAARYDPDRARTIANNHRAKVLLSGVADLTTLDLMSGLAGDHLVREHGESQDLRDGRRTRSTSSALRRLAPTDALRRIPPGEGVLVYGHLPPARIRLRPWYGDRRLSRRGRPVTRHSIARRSDRRG